MTFKSRRRLKLHSYRGSLQGDEQAQVPAPSLPRAVTHRAPARAMLRRLQQTAGNRAVARLASESAAEQARQREDEPKSGFAEWASRLIEAIEVIRTGADNVEAVEATEGLFIFAKGLLKSGHPEVDGRWTTSVREATSAGAGLIAGTASLLVKGLSHTLPAADREILEGFSKGVAKWGSGIAGLVDLFMSVVTLVFDKSASADERAEAAAKVVEGVPGSAKFGIEAVEMIKAAVKNVKGAGEELESATTEAASERVVEGGTASLVKHWAGPAGLAADITWREIKWVFKDVYGPTLNSVPLVGIHGAFEMVKAERVDIEGLLAQVDIVDDALVNAAPGQSPQELEASRVKLGRRLKESMEAFLDHCRPAGPITSDYTTPGHVEPMAVAFAPYQVIRKYPDDATDEIIHYARHLLRTLNWAGDPSHFGSSRAG